MTALDRKALQQATSIFVKQHMTQNLTWEMHLENFLINYEAAKPSEQVQLGSKLNVSSPDFKVLSEVREAIQYAIALYEPHPRLTEALAKVDELMKGMGA